MAETVVQVENVSKKFCRSLRQGMRYTLEDIARETLGLASRSAQLRSGEFWGVDSVSFTLQRGECLGLIGANGAGKSTLLKMINGILRPDKGQIRIRGRIGALIEVGAGFHPLLNGRENIYVSGAILGMSRREVDRKLDSIVAFSGLDSAVLDAPVKTYSSGMYVRLGFSVAIHSEPDILLIDEALSVGDLAFVGKCRRQISSLLEQGTAILFVTHRLQEVEALCRKGILLRAGQIAEEGSARAVVAAYRREASMPTPQGHPARNAAAAPKQEGPRLGAIRFTDAQGADVETIRVGERCHLSVELLDVGADFCGEVRLWLWREDDGSIPTAAAIPWEVVQESPDPRRFACSFPILLMPGAYQLGVLLCGLGRFDYYDMGTAPRFEVAPHPCGPPFTPRHHYAHALLDVRPE